MKRKTLPKARHFSEVENRLRVGGRAAKEFPTPHFSRPRAPRAGGLYKVASARLSEQLCWAARRGTGRAQPRRWPKTCCPPLPGTPGGLLDARTPARRSLARPGREKTEGLGEGGREGGAAVAGLRLARQL